VQAQKEEEDLLADETRALNTVFSQHVAELKVYLSMLQN
jgi:hypothetical protein